MDTLATVFNTAQQESVRAAFALCGYLGDLRTLPLDWGDEVCFILDGEPFYELMEGYDIHDLELVLEGLLNRMVWVLSDIGNPTVAFA